MWGRLFSVPYGPGSCRVENPGPGNDGENIGGIACCNSKARGNSGKENLRRGIIGAYVKHVRISQRMCKNIDRSGDAAAAEEKYGG